MKCLVKVDISVYHSDKTPWICCYSKFNKPVIWGEARRHSTHQTKHEVTNEMQGITCSLCFNSYNTFEFSKHFGVTKNLLLTNWGLDFIGNTSSILKDSIDDLIKSSFSQLLDLLSIFTKGSYHYLFCHLKHCSLTKPLHVKIQLNFYLKMDLHLWMQSRKYKTFPALDRVVLVTQVSFTSV